MRIGEVARRAGVNIETLRYYERRGLVAEPPRGPSGHRTYDEETVRFVRAIKEAQGLGFTLAEIDEYLRVSRRRDASEALRVRVAEKIDQVDAKIAALLRVREGLATVIGCACVTLDQCTCGAGYLARRGLDPAPKPGDVLHVTNGESTGGTLRRTGLGGAVVSWSDVLHEGPVPDVPRDELRKVRAQFLAACGWGDRAEILGGLERRDRHLETALAGERPVVLWFEHDLYDQLQLLEILSLVEEPGAVELIVVGAFEGRPDFKGLGELDADELETLWPARLPVTSAQLELAHRAWAAFRSPRLQPLAGDTSALPFLAGAWRRLLDELPDEAGLGRTERQLLEALPGTPMELFLDWQSREAAPFLGDAWAWKSLHDLRGLVARADGDPIPPPPPLSDPRSFASLPLVLTEEGRAVLAGEATRIELIGIDRWLGGMHITG